MSWFLVALKKYAVFSGRARRKEYWYFTLFYIAIMVLLAIVSGDAISGEPKGNMMASLFGLAMFLPSLGVFIRRLHDTDRSGWWILIGFIPVIGALVLLLFTVLPSQPGHNQYGSSPLEA